MKSRFAGLIAGFIALGLLTFSQAQDTHTFRNAAGQSFEGEVLSVKGGKAEIRRAADGRLFEVPVTALSLEDRKFLVDWMQREKARTQQGTGLPEGWAPLRIHGMYGTDMIYSAGLLLGMHRTGGRVHEGELPVGSWVTISPRRTTEADQDFKSTFVRFDGNPEWHLELREGKLYRSFRKGDDAEVIAAIIPRDNGTAFVEALRSERLAERISFRVNSEAGLDAVEALGHPVAGLFFDNDLPWKDSLTALAPQALSVHGDDELLELLARVPSLEHVTLHESRSQDRWSFEAFQGLKQLPRLQSLWLTTNGRLDARFLSGFDRLRLLSISGSGSDRRALPLPPLKSLEALSISRLFSVAPASLAGFPKLRWINAKGVEPAYEPPEGLVMTSWDSAGGDYETPVVKGLYSGLRILATEEHVDYGKLPNLRFLRIAGITPDLEKLANAPKLRHLHIYEIGQADLEKLAAMPNMQELEMIRLFRGKITDLAPLAKLPQLRILQVDRLSQAPAEIDLSIFPKLEHFRVFDTYEIEKISGAMTHPSLIFLDLMNCRDLNDLGDPAPNDRLESVFINGAKALKSLRVFQQATGLKAVHIWGCDVLTEAPDLEATNDLDYFSVQRSGPLSERQGNQR